MRRVPILQRRKFVLGRDLDDDGVPDLGWLGVDGDDPRWNDAEASTLCAQLDSSENHAKLDVQRLFVMLNADFRPQPVKLPPLPPALRWHRAIDTSLPAGSNFAESGRDVRLDPQDRYIASRAAPACSCAVGGGPAPLAERAQSG